MNEVAVVGIVILLIVLAVIVGISIAINRNTKKQESYPTTVYDKETRNTMIYTGVFIPIIYYILKVDMGLEIYVDHTSYNRIEIGDKIQVARYSNNKYKLEH